MTSDVARWENAQPVVTSPAGGIHRLVDWAQEADAAYQLAQRLTSTAFCPDSFRGKPADAAAAMLAGGELGLSPMTALGAFDVIQGRAAARAITLRALVQARGHEVVLVESTATRCKMKGKRANSSEWQEVTWTIDRARDLNLANKPNWKQQPQAMLLARATSELCRLLASDAILGLGGGYSAEEVADGGPADLAPTAAEAPPQDTGRRVLSRRKATPQPEPEPEPEPERPAEAQQETGEAPSDAAIRAMFASFADAGMPDARTTEGREERLRYISGVVGREVTSSKELTAAEVSQVIDSLKADADWQPADDQGEPDGWGAER